VKAAEKVVFFKNKKSYDEKQYTKKFYGQQCSILSLTFSFFNFW
jgi:hypothetical protein